MNLIEIIAIVISISFLSAITSSLLTIYLVRRYIEDKLNEYIEELKNLEKTAKSLPKEIEHSVKVGVEHSLLKLPTLEGIEKISKSFTKSVTENIKSLIASNKKNDE